MKSSPSTPASAAPSASFAHDSRECATEMRFAVYEPPQAKRGPVPVLYYLAGLTCTEETFMIKAGAQRVAAELGLMLVAPDTSPRQPRLPGRRRELGLRPRCRLLRRRDAGAVVSALPHVQLRDAGAAGADRSAAFPRTRPARASSATRWVVTARCVCALRNPGALPIAVGVRADRRADAVPVGPARRSRGYLGDDASRWARLRRERARRRAASLPRAHPHRPGHGGQIPRRAAAPRGVRRRLPRAPANRSTLRMHAGYDHGYYFIQTFMDEHLRWHAQQLHAGTG